MSDHNPDPEPRRTTGLEPGDQVPPGETPPAEGGMSQTGPQDTRHNPTSGWARGPVIALAILTALFVIGLVAYAVEL